MTNRLAGETSPYLLQHAANPVDWHAWGPEALEMAVKEDKPIFLSVGYSACHWCHVMEHESFENEDVAEIMNKHFVSIKVDREERPDIDDIYQRACQMATGQGGWPLSAFLTPDQKPFYIGTYFPPLDSYGRPGFGSLCRQLARTWEERRPEIQKKAQEFADQMRNASGRGEGRGSDAKSDWNGKTVAIGDAVLDEAAVTLFDMGDQMYGGFGSAPKFPNAPAISFLLRYAHRTGLIKMRGFALKTLDRMARSGIFDQVGGGFHRYSTDSRWFVPHFEKMLYDNALIPVNYAEAYQITGDSFYLGVMEKTLDFVLREMRSPEGGFYSSYDADSEGAEGKFYTWSKKEISEILGSDADPFCLYFDITEGGNWEGSNILHNSVSMSSAAFRLGMDGGRVAESIQKSCAKLLAVRQQREPPARDDKVLVSWNALMVTALVRGYLVAGDSRYLDAAEQCISFVRDTMLDGDRLSHTYKDGISKIDGYLEDYACLANACLDVFGANPNPDYLELALLLGRRMAGHFWDDSAGAFMMTSDEHESLILRPKNIHDLSLPSGNSVAALAMLRLYRMSHDTSFLDVCSKAVESRMEGAAGNPFAFGYLLNVISDYAQKPIEITIINPENESLCRLLQGRYMPNSTLVTVRSREQLDGLAKHQFFEGKEFGPKTSVSVCKDMACLPPMHSISEVEPHLQT